MLVCCCINHIACMHCGINSCKVTGSNAAAAVSSPVHDTGSAVSHIIAFSCALQRPSVATCFCIGVKVHHHHSTAINLSEMEPLSALQSFPMRSDHTIAMSTWCLTMTQQLSMSAWPSSQTSSAGASQVCSLLHLCDFFIVCCSCIILGQTVTQRAISASMSRAWCKHSVQASSGQLQGVLMLLHNCTHVSIQLHVSCSASPAINHSASGSYSKSYGTKLAVLCAEMAMMKSYALASTNPDGKGAANRFVAYMVPKEVPQETPAHPSNRHVHLIHLLCSLLPAAFKATLQWQHLVLVQTFSYFPRSSCCVK